MGTTLLDDLKYIAQRDSSDAFGVAAKQYKQLEYSDFDLSKTQKADYKNITLVGMGGSALAGLICKKWLEDRLEIPFEVIRNYDLPKFVSGDESLVIISSYSGNTEEVISAFEQAKDKQCTIVLSSAGGKLLELAESENLPHLKIPSGIQPRMAVNYSVKILCALFEHLGLIEDCAKELKSAHDFLEAEVVNLEPIVKSDLNKAKQIAEDIVGKTQIVYSGPTLGPAAYKWKISFNESSKNLAWSNEFSEFNHNEFMGWTSHPVEKVFGVINLRSSLDNQQIQKRFEISNRLLSGQMPAPITIDAKGESLIEQLLWTIQLGDFVSLYLAMLNNIDPTPVDLIEKLKKEL